MPELADVIDGLTADTSVDGTEYTLALDGSTLKKIATANIAPTTGLAIASVNPTVKSDAAYRRAFDVFVTYDNPANAPIYQLASTPDFSTQGGIGISIAANWGSNLYGGGTNAKWTITCLGMSLTSRAAGQKIMSTQVLRSYGMGDACFETKQAQFAGGPVAGDEGTGFSLVSSVLQQDHLTLATIVSVVRATLDTTITQAVTADDVPQTVTVASSVGASAGDWLVVAQDTPTGFMNTEAIQVISVGSGTITAIFGSNQNSGATLKPALVLNVDNASQFGEQRTVVNLGGTSYLTGTVTGTSGKTIIGSGTSWANNMVGGDVLNIGAIAFDDDDYSGEPFDEVSGQNSTLKSWYGIREVTNATHLDVMSFTIANNQSYAGAATAGSDYVIKPAARVLRVPNNTTVVCEYSAHTWTAGDPIECAICPYPDMTGFQWTMGHYTPGGEGNRGFMSVDNQGAREIGSAYGVASSIKPGGDANAWGKAFEAVGPIRIGLKLRGMTERAIDLTNENVETSEGWGEICWQNECSLRLSNDNLGMRWQVIHAGDQAKLYFQRNSVISESVSKMNWEGSSKINSYFEMTEISEPPAPPANGGRFWLKDIGGKTALMVRFASGASQEIVREP